MAKNKLDYILVQKKVKSKMLQVRFKIHLSLESLTYNGS